MMMKQTKHFPFSKTNICKCSQQTFYLAERKGKKQKPDNSWKGVGLWGVAKKWHLGRVGSGGDVGVGLGSFEQTNTQLQLQLCLSLRCCAHCKQNFLFSPSTPSPPIPLGP